MNEQTHHNNELFLRPRFSIHCEGKRADVLKKVLSNLEKSNSNYRIKVAKSHVFIDVSEKDSYFWSPQLHFQVVEENGMTKIKGLFGPKPQIWTLFMFVHFGIATAFIGFTMLFYVRNRFDGSVVFPVVMLVTLPILWFLLYFLGQLGKQKGKQQMDGLKEFLKSILKDIEC